MLVLPPLVLPLDVFFLRRSWLA
eukprot:SAG22_NODE_8958_length_618_cov_1.537572_1_plen_22_part_10